MNEGNMQYERVYLEEVDSTFTYAKNKRAEGKNLIVSAKKQTAGQGTKGRSFSSNEGGVYVTKLTFYENFPAQEAFMIMKSAAAAVCETLVFFGLTPQIKWPNDIFVGNKKICGILIENALRGNQIASSLVGVGLNVSNALPADLQTIATSMQQETGNAFSIAEVLETLVHFLCSDGIGERYEQYLGWMGEWVELSFGEERIPALLRSVDEEGGLWVEIDGEHKRFVAAEVSICKQSLRGE